MKIAEPTNHATQNEKSGRHQANRFFSCAYGTKIAFFAETVS